MIMRQRDGIGAIQASFNGDGAGCPPYRDVVSRFPHLCSCAIATRGEWLCREPETPLAPSR
jgi:hypothetical protein